MIQYAKANLHPSRIPGYEYVCFMKACGIQNVTDRAISLLAI